MSDEEFYKRIVDAVVQLDEEAGLALAEASLKENKDPLKVIENGYSAGIRKIGDLWEQGDIFLPELIIGAKIVESALQLLLPHIQEGEQRQSLGKVVIATVEGDIHSIGKNIVGTMLSAYGFTVLDLGEQIPAETIVKTAIEEQADVIALSTLLTTTMPNQKAVVDLLNQKNMRDQFKVIFGGAPVTPDWAESAGADGYASNATEAVKEVKKLLNV
ncbi:MAG: cobalamin B12-binding domain-containing protein [Candidatus Ranarchaeia archaeon]|jgi:trimethylamine corrinoid protein